jgi:hypothetical protein
MADPQRIQRHTLSFDGGASIHGVSVSQPRRAQALAALHIKKPAIDSR